MDSIFSFFKTLVPDLTKDRLLEDVRNTRIMLENLTDIYAVFSPVARTHKFQDKEVVDRFEKFKRIVGTRDNPVVFLEKNIPIIIKNLDVIKGVFFNETNKVILAGSLTVKQANLIAYIDALYLVNKGARKFLVWLEAREAAHFNRTENELVEEVTPAEQKWLAESFVDFCNAVKIVTMSPDKTMEKLESVVDAQANDKSFQALKAAGRINAADPLSLGFIGTKYNPVVFVRMLVAEWQVARYREADEELKGLKLQASRLENTSRNKSDPRVEQEIRYIRGRVNELAQDVSEMEKKYG